MRTVLMAAVDAWTALPEHQSNNSVNRPQLAGRSGRPPRVTPQGRAGARARDAPGQADSAHPTPAVSAHRCLLEVDGNRESQGQWLSRRK